MVQHDSVKNQASNALNRLHSWTKTQAQIRARRANMVMEGKLRQKKLENQMKLEAKLHDFEVIQLFFFCFIVDKILTLCLVRGPYINSTEIINFEQ